MHFSQELCDVGYLGFDLVWDGPALSGGVGALDEEEVWERGGCETQVGVWVGGPDGSEIVAVGDDRERGAHADVCACGADDGVDFSFDTVDGEDALFGELLDVRADEGDVVLGEGFEVSWSGG